MVFRGVDGGRSPPCDVTPVREHGDMAPSAVTSIDFAATARAITRAARRAQVLAPAFRSPPGLVGADRTIRRRDEGCVVAIRVAGRPWPAVQADMIEGVVVANGLSSPQADRLRNVLWQAAADTATSTGLHRSHAA